MDLIEGSTTETSYEGSHSTTWTDSTGGIHGTRPPISQLHLGSLPEVQTSFVNDEEQHLRPPPAPSIPGDTADTPQPARKYRKGCLKRLSPLPSPPISSSLPPLSFDGHPTPPALERRSSSSSSLESSPCLTPRKCVSWRDERESALRCLEEIFPADEWDRTATEPVRTPLSYKDILELKAIQRSLPCAQQLPDPYTGKPVNQYLTNVPIALLPLLPDSAPHTPLTTPNMSPNNSSGGTPYGSGNSSPTDLSPKDSKVSSPRLSPRVSPTHSPASRSPNQSPERSNSNTPTFLQPAHTVHTHAPRISSPLAPSPSPPSFSYSSPPPPPSPSASSPITARSRPKPAFTFLPLLETPVPSPHASAPTSAPVSPPSNPTADPLALDAALGKLCQDPSYSLNEDGSGSPPTPALTVTSLNGDSCSEVDTELSDIGDDIPFGVSFKRNLDMSYESSRRGRERGRDKERTIKSKPKKKRNVIFINGEEVDLDEDDSVEQEERQSRTPSPIESSSSSSNIIYINGEACSLDDIPTTRPRTPSPDPRTDSECRRQPPISPFHRAHPNLSRNTSPDETLRSASPISPFHQAHPNIRLRSLSPARTTMS